MESERSTLLKIRYKTTTLSKSTETPSRMNPNAGPLLRSSGTQESTRSPLLDSSLNSLCLFLCLAGYSSLFLEGSASSLIIVKTLHTHLLRFLCLWDGLPTVGTV